MDSKGLCTTATRLPLCRRSTPSSQRSWTHRFLALAFAVPCWGPISWKKWTRCRRMIGWRWFGRPGHPKTSVGLYRNRSWNHQNQNLKHSKTRFKIISSIYHDDFKSHKLRLFIQEKLNSIQSTICTPTHLWFPDFFQVSVGEEAPAVLTPLKPKVFLLGSLSIEPAQAIKLA